MATELIFTERELSGLLAQYNRMSGVDQTVVLSHGPDHRYYLESRDGFNRVWIGNDVAHACERLFARILSGKAWSILNN